jgi:hypothetical protein
LILSKRLVEEHRAFRNQHQLRQQLRHRSHLSLAAIELEATMIRRGLAA